MRPTTDFTKTLTTRSFHPLSFTPFTTKLMAGSWRHTLLIALRRDLTREPKELAYEDMRCTGSSGYHTYTADTSY
jgi:hypothetical protein